MMSARILLTLPLLAGFLLSGCGLLPQLPEDSRLRQALERYTSAKTASEQDTRDTEAQEMLAQARKSYEDTVLAAAEQQRDEGNLFQAQQVLKTALEQVPDSRVLLDAHAAIENERAERLRINDCRIGAARARYLTDKSDLLQQRAPLSSKDFLQDWLSRREREELDQLAVQLRDCANQAIAEQRLELADETLAAAIRISGEEYLADERQQLEKLKHPEPTAQPEKPKPVVKRPVEDTPQLKIRRARIALQSAMTRGDLRQAKARISELRQLEGDTPQLLELDQAVSEAIAAYIAETHERANTLYRDRQIEQARDLWQKILEIDPEDIQARANIERAERVLKKLEELQGVTPEPAPASPEPAPEPVPTPVPQAPALP